MSKSDTLDVSVETVARAICRASCSPSMSADAVECQVEHAWDMWANEARAAIAAMPRTPSVETIRVLVETLASIREDTDPDGTDNYRGDDREGCLDSVFAQSDRALTAFRGGEA